MASSVAASLRALAAASLPKPSPAPSSPFLVLLAPALPRRLLRLRSARRLLLAPLAASDSVGVDYAEPAESEQEEAFAPEEDEGAEDDAVEASTAVEDEVEEEVGEYVEPPEEAKVYVGNLPYDIDSEGLAQLFEKAGVVEVAEVTSLQRLSLLPPPYPTLPCHGTNFLNLLHHGYCSGIAL
ncbi:unnamed protein product [Miscanthus lutarioriparius]|uniref:RRM domain-containing protein n=1 Tax=Miscanthus lutarioriparius TaxID=422564 RepID=A0A811NQ65_9POAL|nr:unnamed protein product [Miscanthus lutarioriparius]